MNKNFLLNSVVLGRMSVSSGDILSLPLVFDDFDIGDIAHFA